MENVLINVDNGNETATAVHLDVSKRTNIIDATGRIQGVEHRCKGTQMIVARNLDLTHHANHNGTCLTDGNPNVRTAIAASQTTTHLVLSGCNRQTAHLDRTIAGNGHGTFRRDRQAKRFL